MMTAKSFITAFPSPGQCVSFMEVRIAILSLFLILVSSVAFGQGRSKTFELHKPYREPTPVIFCPTKAEAVKLVEMMSKGDEKALDFYMESDCEEQPMVIVYTERVVKTTSPDGSPINVYHGFRLVMHEGKLRPVAEVWVITDWKHYEVET